MAAGSCGAIQGANRAKITKMTTNTTPVAASGLWRAFTATERRNEMAEVDKLAVEFYSLIILLTATCEGLWRARFSLDEGIPPPSYPLKGLLGAGFAKSVGKILMAKSLEVKI